MTPTSRPLRVARHSERGSAAIEFALLAPILLMLVVGIVAYGYMLSFRQAVSQGATEGARAAAVSAYPTQSQKVGDAVASVNDSLASYGVTCVLPSGMSAGTLQRGGESVGTCGVASATCANNALASCMSVQIVYDYAHHPLVPDMPGLGVVMPHYINYTAVAQVG